MEREAARKVVRLKWHRISDYAITNGQEFSGPKDAYRHGTHIINKSAVNGKDRYTLYQGEQWIAVRDTAEELKKMAEEKANEMQEG